MIPRESIENYIGVDRWLEYAKPFPELNGQSISSCYKFDIELRGFLLSAISVIEISLVTQLSIIGVEQKFDSFGQARRALENIPRVSQNLIARNLGVGNYKKLRGALQNLNYLRNRLAHHERVWNHRNRFAFPDLDCSNRLQSLGFVKNRHVLAYSLVGMAAILQKCPDLVDFENRLQKMTKNWNVSQSFLLKCMGFEVP